MAILADWRWVRSLPFSYQLIVAFASFSWFAFVDKAWTAIASIVTAYFGYCLWYWQSYYFFLLNWIISYKSCCFQCFDLSSLIHESITYYLKKKLWFDQSLPFFEVQMAILVSLAHEWANDSSYSKASIRKATSAASLSLQDCVDIAIELESCLSCFKKASRIPKFFSWAIWL